MHLHTDSEGVFSGFKGRYQFMQAKNEFGDCGGNISNSENGVIKSPNYPEKYSTNDPSMYTAYHVSCIMYYVLLELKRIKCLEKDGRGKYKTCLVLNLNKTFQLEVFTFRARKHPRNISMVVSIFWLLFPE